MTKLKNKSPNSMVKFLKFVHKLSFNALKINYFEQKRISNKTEKTFSGANVFSISWNHHTQMNLITSSFYVQEN